VRQLLEPLLMDAGEADRPMAGAAATAKVVFDPHAEGGDSGSFAALHGLYWLVVNLAAEKLLPHQIAAELDA
jgi:hypothetical protein